MQHNEFLPGPGGLSHSGLGGGPLGSAGGGPLIGGGGPLIIWNHWKWMSLYRKLLKKSTSTFHGHLKFGYFFTPPPFFWISLVGIFSSKCMNISIKYTWIKIKFTHFREIIITITTNQKKGQVRGMIVVSKLKVLCHTPVLDFNTYNSWRRAQSSWGKSWWELHLWGRTRHRWHTCTMKKRVEFPLVFFTF